MSAAPQMGRWDNGTAEQIVAEQRRSEQSREEQSRVEKSKANKNSAADRKEEQRKATQTDMENVIFFHTNVRLNKFTPNSTYFFAIKNCNKAGEVKNSIK